MALHCCMCQDLTYLMESCQKWDLNPRLQWRLRPERSALDRSAILTAKVEYIESKAGKDVSESVC